MAVVAGKRVVILGDSHVDGSTFGKALERMLTSSGASVTRFGWGGSAARTWLAGKPIFDKQYTLEQVRNAGPWDIAIVSLGTNDGANGGKAAGGNAAQATKFAVQAAADIKKVGDATGARVVYWAEPPTMSPKNASKGGESVPWYTPENIGLVRTEGRKLFGSRAIDATSVGLPDGDGIHLGGKGGEAWARVVHDYILADTASLGTPAWMWLASVAAIGLALVVRFKVRR